MTRKTAEEIRTNILALLNRDKLTPAALSFACGHNRSWMSRFLQRKRHELQLSDLDRIADFLHVATYDLFRPSAGSITDRRHNRDRRIGSDRRVGHAVRGMLQTASAIDPYRPQGKGPHAVVTSPIYEELARLTAAHERAVTALLSKAESGGQASAPRRAVAGTRPRRRAVRRPDPTKD